MDMKKMPSPAPVSLTSAWSCMLMRDTPMVGARWVSPVPGSPTSTTLCSLSVKAVLASIGDTWRLTVNKTTGAYTVTPNNSQYGLAAESGTLTRAVSGDFVTYTLANKISLTQDTRTAALSGSMTVGSQTATVSGTPYQVSNASKLAGTDKNTSTIRITMVSIQPR